MGAYAHRDDGPTWMTDADRLEDALSKLRAVETQRDSLRLQLEVSRNREVNDAVNDLIGILNRLRKLEVRVEVDDVELADAVDDLGALIRWATGKAHHARTLSFDRDDQTWSSVVDLRAGQTARIR